MMEQRYSISVIPFIITASLCASLFLTLNACSNHSEITSKQQNHSTHQMLEQQLTEIPHHPSGQIEPLPKRVRQYSPVYTGNSLRDPFSPKSKPLEALGRVNLSSAKKTLESLKPPNKNHQKTQLENQPLETLTLVGTLQFTETEPPTALIDSGKDELHKVTVGQYLGPDFGRVTKITSDTIFIEEIVQDERGLWIKRPKQLKLAMITDE